MACGRHRGYLGRKISFQRFAETCGAADLASVEGRRCKQLTRDGVEGEIDLSEFATKKLFAAWQDPGFFQKVEVGPYRQIRWSDEIELCPDSLYMRLTGSTPEQFLAKSAAAPAHA